MKQNSPNAPLYQNRAVQVAQHLKERILCGEWRQRLPAERTLAKELNIGRMTLRSALDKLEANGLIIKEGASGTRLRKSRRHKHQYPAKKVGILIGGKLERLHNNAIMLVDELRRIFYTKNIALHLHDHTTSLKRGIFPFFKHLVHTLNYNAWILCGGTLEMQQWCEKNKIPVVMAAALFEGVHLPSVELHFRGTCRHAVGEMVRRGHRSIAFILPHTPANSGPGDIQSRLGFLEAVEISRPTKTVGTVEFHTGAKSSIYKLVDNLLSRSPRPTAWLIPTENFLTVMTYLLKLKIRIPEDISLVCRDSEFYHESITPEPTRYTSDMRIKAKQIGILVQHVLTNLGDKKESKLIMPDFLPGETLGTILH